MRLLTFCLVAAAALAALPGTGAAQYGGYGRGGMGGGRQSPNGLPEAESMERRSVDAGPKSEELVDLKPFLRGIKLTPVQDSAVKAIRERFDPQLLPMYDWLRDQMVKRQKGQEVDMAVVQRRFERVDALRKREVEEVRVVLTEEQQKRLQKNIDEEQERQREDAARSASMRERQAQQRPPQ